MKHRIAAVTALMALSCAFGASGVTADEMSERDAIEARILDYFQGQGDADKERLERAFAEDVAVMINAQADGEGFQRREMSDIIGRWSANPNPPGERTDYEILSIEIVDDRLATATFRYTDRFYDAFILIKHDGEWQIVTKAFVPQ